MRRLILTEPVLSEYGLILGSYFTGTADAAAVLTFDQIKSKHNLTGNELVRIRRQLRSMTMEDALFHFPDGPYYDVLLRMVAACR